jgi:hypothetical protein
VYRLRFNQATRLASVTSTITFDVAKEGYPLFDSVHEPASVTLDGEPVTQRLVRSPGKATAYRMIDKPVSLGEHRMVIVTPLRNGVIFTREGPVAGFFMNDLEDREFLERYVPGNLEYDQVKMSFVITVSGGTSDMEFFTNGEVETVSPGRWRVNFPDYYNIAAPYFHMTPKGRFRVMRRSLRSVNGRGIPVTIYGRHAKLNAYWNTARTVFHDLENDYGAWKHPQLLIYGVTDDAMEYHGATITDHESLSHEMAHMYFGRGVMPVDGDSGWLDEAIVTWSDENYARPDQTTFSGVCTNMARRSPYVRTTDDRAYVEGARFIAFLDAISAEQRDLSLKAFLRKLASRRLFSLVSTSRFQHDLENWLGVERGALSEHFGYSVLGKPCPGRAALGRTESAAAAAPAPRFHHRLRSRTGLDSLL